MLESRRLRLDAGAAYGEQPAQSARRHGIWPDAWRLLRESLAPSTRSGRNSRCTRRAPAGEDVPARRGHCATPIDRVVVPRRGRAPRRSRGARRRNYPAAAHDVVAAQFITAGGNVKLVAHPVTGSVRTFQEKHRGRPRGDVGHGAVPAGVRAARAADTRADRGAALKAVLVPGPGVNMRLLTMLGATLLGGVCSSAIVSPLAIETEPRHNRLPGPRPSRRTPPAPVPRFDARRDSSTDTYAGGSWDRGPRGPGRGARRGRRRGFARVPASSVPGSTRRRDRVLRRRRRRWIRAR